MATIEHISDTAENPWVDLITKYFRHQCTSCGDTEYVRIRCAANGWFCATCRSVVYSFVHHYNRHHAPITWEQRKEQKIVYSIDYNLFLTIITSNNDLTRQLMDHFMEFMTSQNTISTNQGMTSQNTISITHDTCMHPKIMDDVFGYNGRTIWTIGVENSAYASHLNGQARFSRTCGLYVFSQYDVFADETNPPTLTWTLVNRARKGLLMLDESMHGDLDRYIFDPCNALIAIRYLFM